MPTDNMASKYRERAAECLASAGLAVDPTERLELLQIAQKYYRLADHLSAKAARLKGTLIAE
jgi:hypothetical protein